MKPPFRADQVGSLLRPAELAEARLRAKKGELDAAALQEVQDRCIREAVAKQESIGLESITDGEYRRDWWHVDFLAGIDGVAAKFEKLRVGFVNTEEQPPLLGVTGKVKRSGRAMVDHFEFLKSATGKTAKFTIPAPGMLHLRGGREAVSEAAYPDIDEFWHDIVAAYRIAVRQLYDAGCRYLQLDDVSFAYLCDDNFRAMVKRRGDDPDRLMGIYADALAGAVAERPADMTATMHTCRGNFRSTWVASGGYDAVADTLFSRSGVDGWFLEFDSDRAGSFEPLRYVPKGRKVVLGLVTTKAGSLEDKDTLKRRIEAASKYVPLEDLCLSPQCGFSSTYHGNALAREEQWAKLARIVEVADEVWR